ncbi:MAG: efflux RND transporter periplasmic adaptor subunit [Paraglaciecola sp.]|uniref:efflux RND transporter periplasmic adaptor subunit n=1 Tax=Paraglaciecola sp. TaxID=1920173 RepID=UPI00329A63D3
MNFKLSQNIVIGLLVAALLLGCQDANDKVTSEPAKLVKAITLKDEGQSKYRNFPAIVEASEDAILAFRVSGQLEQLLVLPGAQVQTGELLAKLDPSDYLLALESAQANYDLALSQFTRSEKLLSEKLVSRSGFDEAKSQLQVTDAALKVAKANVAYTELHAPFTGQIAQRFVQNFENITAKQSIVTLQKSETIDVAIQVPEDVVSNIDETTTYQPEVRFEADKSKVFRAKLKEFDTEANSATKSYQVVFSLPKPVDFNILPGMSATVSIELDKVMKSKQGGWNIPSAAIFSEVSNGQENSYVWRINAKNQLEKVQVTFDGFNENGFNVISGLNYGDSIVSAGVQLLSENDTVSIWHKERGL